MQRISAILFKVLIIIRQSNGGLVLTNTRPDHLNDGGHGDEMSDFISKVIAWIIVVVLLLIILIVPGILVDRYLILEPYNVKVHYVDNYSEDSFGASEDVYHDDSGVDFPNLTTQPVSINGASMMIDEDTGTILISLHVYKDENELCKEYQQFVEKQVREKEKMKDYYRQQLKALGDDPNQVDVVH